MTKNTNPKLTLLFCLNKKNGGLDKALDAIARQTDKNFNLIFIFNGSSTSDKDIFAKYKFTANKIDYIFISENVGDVYANRYAASKNIHTKYEYYFDSNVILMPDFVAVINQFLDKHEDADVVSFFGVPNIYFKEEYKVIKTPSDDFAYRPLVFFDNKIINIEYIKKISLNEPLFKTYPLYFYIQLFKGNPKWYSIGRQICNGSTKRTYQFNIMDLFDQCVEVTNLLEDDYYKKHFSEVEYLVITTLFRNFTFAFFQKNQGNLILQKRMLNKIEDFIDTNYPNWEKNEWLDSKKNHNDETYLNYLREFKPKLFHVKNALRSKLQIQGHGNKK